MSPSVTSRRVLTCTAVAVTAAAVLAGTATAASAAPAPPLAVTYDAAGTSTVLKTGSVVALGPTTLDTLIRPSGKFTGSLVLPPAQTSFKLLGLLPVKATVTFISVGKVTGQVGGSPPTVTSVARYTIRLSDVTVAGLPASVGATCQTAAPVSITLTTPAGESFNVLTGGNVAGTYTIGNFANCGLTTALLNMLIPGPNNPVTVALSNARITGS